MRPLPIAIFVSMMAIVGWAVVLWELVRFGEMTLLSFSVAVSATVMVVLMPVVLGGRRSTGSHACRECGQPLATAARAGFCLRCGCFTSAAAERYYARRV